MAGDCSTYRQVRSWSKAYMYIETMHSWVISVNVGMAIAHMATAHQLSMMHGHAGLNKHMHN